MTQEPNAQPDDGSTPAGQQPQPGYQPPPPPGYAPPPPGDYQPPAPGYQPPPPYGYAQPGTAQGYPPNPTEKTWASAAHWSSVIASFVALAFLGPLLVMLIKGNESPYVRRHAVEALNFQLSALIYLIVSVILALVLIGFLLLVGLLVLWLVGVISGSIKGANGEDYRYPLCIRFIS